MLGKLGCLMVGGGLLFAASAAMAVDPSIKCQTDKLRLISKYAACRLAAEATAARSFSAPQFDSCESSYLSGWSKAESRARAKGVACWTEGDADVVKGSLDAHLDSLAESLAGGGK